MYRYIAIVVLLSSFALAGDTPKPTLSDANKLAIRNAQVQWQNIQLQQANLQQQWNNLQKQGQDSAVAVNTSIEKAFKDAGLKQEEWTLDQDLNLVKKEVKK